MDALDCIKTRRSIRKYADAPIEFEKVGEVINAGLNAPSAGNVQDWKFILVTELEVRQQISEACLQQYWMQSAPVHIVVCVQPEKSERFYGERGRRVYSLQNCAAAVENMLLAANACGLGACWIGAFHEGMLRTALNIPDSVIPQAVITLGYADESPLSPPKLTMENVVFVEKWGNKIRDIASYMENYAEHVQKAWSAGKKLAGNVIEKIKK